MANLKVLYSEKEVQEKILEIVRRIEKFDFVNHAFSTKLGGVSKDEFASMNLSFSSKDKRENVEEENNTQRRPFLGIWFDCCGVYGRIYKNKQKILRHARFFS